MDLHTGRNESSIIKKSLLLFTNSFAENDCVRKLNLSLQQIIGAKSFLN